MRWIVVNELIGGNQARGGGYWLTAAGVARETRMRPARYLHAYPLAWLEVIRGRPERDLNMVYSVTIWQVVIRRQAQDAIAEIDRLA